MTPPAADAVETEPVVAVIEPPAISQENADVLARLASLLGPDAIIESVEALGDLIVRVAPTSWAQTAKVCRENLGFDYLSFISGIDWMPMPAAGGDDAGGDTSAPVQPKETTYGKAGSAGRFQVFARVASTRQARTGLTLKTDVDHNRLTAQSWCGTYPGADWHERECWEMFGISFEGHPSLRHLYLPSGFEGFPLRKDFPLLAREVKPWPGLVNVEAMPGEPDSDGDADTTGVNAMGADA